MPSKPKPEPIDELRTILERLGDVEIALLRHTIRETSGALEAEEARIRNARRILASSVERLSRTIRELERRQPR